MTGKDIIKSLMKEEDVTNAQLANSLGITQATMWARLNYQGAKDLPLAVFSEMIGALGYEIVIRKSGATDGEKREMMFQIDAPLREEGRGRPRMGDIEAEKVKSTATEVPAK